jgi:hypothetical protein
MYSNEEQLIPPPNKWEKIAGAIILISIIIEWALYLMGVIHS